VALDFDEQPLSVISAAPELAREIEDRSAPMWVEEGVVLFRQGDPPGQVYYVKSGEIALTIRASGYVLMQASGKAGSLLGLPSSVSNEPFTMTATTVRKAEICRIDRAQFRDLMAENPQLHFNVLQILAAEVCAARKAMSKLLG
jgi:CRP-like cAMP-binding protein